LVGQCVLFPESLAKEKKNSYTIPIDIDSCRLGPTREQLTGMHCLKDMIAFKSIQCPDMSSS